MRRSRRVRKKEGFEILEVCGVHFTLLAGAVGGFTERFLGFTVLFMNGMGFGFTALSF